MSKKLAELAHRKEALLAQCARERDELGSGLGRLKTPIDLSGVVFGVSKTLKTHPLLAAGISSLLASGYARSLVKLTGESLRLWRLLLPVLRWWKTIKA